jgi:hypothetical protein
MNLRRPLRFVVIALCAASFGACHFHGGGWGHCSSHQSHYHVPVRHCR